MTSEQMPLATPPLCPMHRTQAQEVCGRCGRFCCGACGRATAEGWRCPECATTTPVPSPRAPWLSMWFAPRDTVRVLIERGGAPLPSHFVAACGGVFLVLGALAEWQIGDREGLALILPLALLGGTLLGMARLYAAAGLFTLAGRFLGGKGRFAEVRTAVAWAELPLMWGLALCWAPRIAVLGASAFSVHAPMPNLDLATLLLRGWSFFLIVKAVAEAHRMPDREGLHALVLVALLVILPWVAISWIAN